MPSDHDDVARALAALGCEMLPYRTFITSNGILAHGSSCIHDNTGDEDAPAFPLLAAALPGSAALLSAPAGAAVMDLGEAFQRPPMPDDQAALASTPVAGTSHHPRTQTDASRPQPCQDREVGPGLRLEEVFRALRNEPASTPPEAVRHDADLKAVFGKL